MRNTAANGINYPIEIPNRVEIWKDSGKKGLRGVLRLFRKKQGEAGAQNKLKNKWTTVAQGNTRVQHPRRGAEVAIAAIVAQ